MNLHKGAPEVWQNPKASYPLLIVLVYQRYLIQPSYQSEKLKYEIRPTQLQQASLLRMYRPHCEYLKFVFHCHSYPEHFEIRLNQSL